MASNHNVQPHHRHRSQLAHAQDLQSESALFSLKVNSSQVFTTVTASLTSFFLLPELSISVEHQARATLLPLELNLFLEEPLSRPLLPGHVLVQSLMTLPLLTPVIVLGEGEEGVTCVSDTGLGGGVSGPSRGHGTYRASRHLDLETLTTVAIPVLLTPPALSSVLLTTVPPPCRFSACSNPQAESPAYTKPTQSTALSSG